MHFFTHFFIIYSMIFLKCNIRIQYSLATWHASNFCYGLCRAFMLYFFFQNFSLMFSLLFFVFYHHGQIWICRTSQLLWLRLKVNLGCELLGCSKSTLHTSIDHPRISFFISNYANPFILLHTLNSPSAVAITIVKVLQIQIWLW